MDVSTVLILYRNHVVHEKRSGVPPSWQKQGRVSKDVVLPVRIGLAQNNLEKGHSYLMDVSNPKSANYAQYWSAEKVHDTFAPSKEAVDEVKKWLDSFGIADHRVAHSKNKGWLAFDAQSHEVEKLLGTEYYEFAHKDGEVRIGNDG
jgi:tripeptidyl-peptidase-1